MPSLLLPGGTPFMIFHSHATRGRAYRRDLPGLAAQPGFTVTTSIRGA
jgi:hypothetical protein